MVLNFEKATMSCRDGSKANDCKAVRSMLVDKWAMITGLEKEGPLHFPGTQISVSHVVALLHVPCPDPLFLIDFVFYNSHWPITCLVDSRCQSGIQSVNSLRTGTQSFIFASLSFSGPIKVLKTIYRVRH